MISRICLFFSPLVFLSVVGLAVGSYTLMGIALRAIIPGFEPVF